MRRNARKRWRGWQNSNAERVAATCAGRGVVVVTRTARPGAGAWVPPAPDLGDLATAARGCQGCELFAPATQTVFGAGPAGAALVMVGEQPGDVEDRRGEPFVGPAGRLLDQALVDAGLDRSMIYLTNAVKHFRFTERGKRRLHRSPDTGHIVACRPWLSAELAATKPDLIVALGAVAGRALLGPAFRVTKERGMLLPWPDRADPGLGVADAPPAQLVATVHPSAILRAEDRDAAYAGLVADLAVAAAALS